MSSIILPYLLYHRRSRARSYKRVRILLYGAPVSDPPLIKSINAAKLINTVPPGGFRRARGTIGARSPISIRIPCCVHFSQNDSNNGLA